MNWSYLSVYQWYSHLCYNNLCWENKPEQETQTLDDSTYASQNPYLKSPPSDYPPKATGVDQFLPEDNKAINETKTGKISFKTQCWIQTIQICRKSSMVWTVLLMPTHQTMSHNSYSITNIKSKANVFINYYTGVSKLDMSRVDWDLNRQFKKRLNVPSADDETCAPLQMGEVLSAIKKMKCKEAAGSDNIIPSFLKSLSPLELQELLSMFTLSFSFAHCPCIWRAAIIIELLKVGKSPIEVASFCPVTLTSRIVKLLERIFADCLYYTSETKNLFSQFQARFCKGQNWGRSLTSLVSVFVLHKV